jgi:hypothetical protein
MKYKPQKKVDYRSLSKLQLIKLVKQLTSKVNELQLEESLYYEDKYVDLQERR